MAKVKIKVKCKRCGYSWETNSVGMYVNCPKCRTSVKVRDFEEMDL